MNKKNMAMLIAIAMIFSLFTGINFGTGKAQAEDTDLSGIIAASECAIKVSGKTNSDVAKEWNEEYSEYKETAEKETEAVSKAAFTITGSDDSSTTNEFHYYIDEMNDDAYKVKDLNELKSLDGSTAAHWIEYSNQKITLSDYAGKQIVIYAKFKLSDGKVAYLHTKIIEIAKVTPMETPTATPTATATATPTETPTATPIATPMATPTATPTATPSQSPTGTPTAEPSQNPTGTPTVEPSQSPTGTPTVEPSQNPMVTPTVEPSKTPDKKLSVNYDNSDKYVKRGTALNLKVTVETDAQCTYKWYKKGSDKSLSEKSSYKTPKNAKIGKYTYYCEISADGYETVKCEFTVIVYKSVITVAWGSSAASKGIFGTSPNVKKITVPSKYKKNLSVNAKNAKISVKKYFSGKAVVTYVIGKNKIKITVKSKIPQIKYKATYSKKGKSLKIKIDSFAMKNLGNVYFMINGKKWTPVSYRLKDYGKKKGSYIIVGNLNSVVKKIECKFILGTTKYTAKAWKCSANAKKNKVKLVS